MKSLGALLRLRTLAERQRIALVWGVAPPTSDDAEEGLRLERFMRDAIAARTVWDGLDADSRLVLRAILGPSARNWCQRELLPERAGLDAARANTALEHLRAIFLVDEEAAKVQGGELVGQRSAFYGYTTTRSLQEPVVETAIIYVPTEIATMLYTVGREFLPLQPDRTTLSLDQLLLPYRQGDLDQIGRRFGLVLHSYCSRNEARAAVAANVTQAEAVHYALGQIDAPLRDIFEWLTARGGRAKVTELSARMHWDLPTTLQALRTFEEYAIAFDAFSDGERVIFIPASTFDNLRRASARPRSEVGLQPRTAPRAVRSADTAILWDIVALVATVAQHEIELTRADMLPKRIAQRVMPLLNNDLARQDEEVGLTYLKQLQRETIDLGILRVTAIDGHTRLELGPKLDAWSQQDARMQTHRIIRRWPQNRSWRDHAGAGFAGWHAEYLHVNRARGLLLDALRQCEHSQWYDIASLLRTIQGDDPFAVRPNQRWSGQGGFQMTDEVRSHWNETDGELLIGMLSSTLHDLGIIALGYDDDDVPLGRNSRNPDAFLLTELGAEVLHGDLDTISQASERPLVLQPNFEVLSLEPHMPALYWLVRFALPEQIGRASRFKLTRESLLRGMSQGTALDDVVAFMRSHSQRDLPQNVLYTLSDWARQYKDTHLSNVVLIEVDSEDVASELCSSAKLRALGLRRVGPLAVAAPEGTALRHVRRAIERAGYATHAPVTTESAKV